MSEYDKMSDADKIEVWREAMQIAQAENADLRAKLAAVTKDRDNELADNTGLALKCAALAEECDNFKTLASRETSRRLEAEKARDEEAEAKRVLGRELFNRCFLGYDKAWRDAEIAKINNPTAAAAVKVPK